MASQHIHIHFSLIEEAKDNETAGEEVDKIPYMHGLIQERSQFNLWPSLEVLPSTLACLSISWLWMHLPCSVVCQK